MFNMLNVSEAQISLPDLLLETAQSPEQGSKFDLTLYAAEQAEALLFTFVYNTDLFEEATAAHRAEPFGPLLNAVVRDPRRPVSALLRQVEEERRRPALRGPSMPSDETF